MTPNAELGPSGEIDTAPRRWPSWLSTAVLVVGLILTASLVAVASSIHNHNEQRLLNVELHQAATVVSAAIPTIQIPLTSAADLAAATDGNVQQFRQYLT